MSNVPNPSIKKGTIKEKLIVFLEETLFKFQEHFKGKVNEPEEDLNEQLGKTLNHFSKSQPFIFQPEARQGNGRKVDIGVFKHFADTTPFFTIEAKRLSTSIPNNREKEYVLGSDPNKFTGGIERFKQNVHGVKLDHSALIGYVQDKDGNHWFNVVNCWIQELIDNNVKSPLQWISNDLLINTCGFKDLRYAKFTSESEKIDKTKINLNHYFVNLCL
ncbi:MAG TPA: hypothetical protein VK169_20060 [Saprospiraceae bacterium]|nr:hypothetical protein [Saprospiraceae bacterium]